MRAVADFPNLTLIDHPLVQHKLTLMRQRNTATADFRRLLREIAMLLTYDLTRSLPLEHKTIHTPLCKMEAPVIAGKKLALISVLRAGNGLLDGVLELIPSARVGFIGLYRDPQTQRPVEYYSKLPDHIEQRFCLVVDPMLATGFSAVAAVDLLKKAGAQHIKLMCLLAAPEGVKQMADHHPDVDIFTAALDSHLNDHAYIVPGLGDAGDRMFGT